MLFHYARSQQQRDRYYNASGTITLGGTAQLLLPQSKSRSHLMIINNSIGMLNIQFGVLPGVASLTSGVVTSVSVPDAGFGFLVPPAVRFLGGGNANDPSTKGATMPDWPSPFAPASGRAILSGGAIASITVDNGGSGYLVPPYVDIEADRTDPTGVGLASATTFPILPNGGSAFWNGTACSCEAISIWGATTAQAYICHWMT